MPAIQHLLIVDDDTRIRKLLKQFLVDHGYIVSTAKDAAEARLLIGMFIFDLIVVDVMMPGETGLELTRSLQPTMDTPFLILSAMGEAEDRINGLECGAEDYLAKPFEPKELLLRVQKIMHRTQTPSPSFIRFGDCRFDLDTKRLYHGTEEVVLTSTEQTLLHLLGQRIGEPLSREELAENMGGMNDRSIDVQITRLRNKIEPNPKKPHYLRTLRGKGYCLHA